MFEKSKNSEKGGVFFNEVFWNQTSTCTGTNEKPTQSVPQTLYNNQLEMDYRPTYKT